MCTHWRWYRKHRGATDFHGHHFLGMHHLAHHCVGICCLPVVPSIQMLLFRSFGFEQSIPQPTFNTTQTARAACLGHRIRQDVLWCDTHTPMKARSATSTRTCRCRRVFRHVPCMHTPTPERKREKARAIWDGAPCSRTVVPQVHRRTPCWDFSPLSV